MTNGIWWSQAYSIEWTSAPARGAARAKLKCCAARISIYGKKGWSYAGMAGNYFSLYVSLNSIFTKPSNKREFLLNLAPISIKCTCYGIKLGSNPWFLWFLKLVVLYTVIKRFQQSACKLSTIARRLLCPPLLILAFWICYVVKPDPNAFQISFIRLSIKPTGLYWIAFYIPRLCTCSPIFPRPLFLVVVICCVCTCSNKALSNRYLAAALTKRY